LVCYEYFFLIEEAKIHKEKLREQVYSSAGDQSFIISVLVKKLNKESNQF
jgi:hypothetical protein